MHLSLRKEKGTELVQYSPVSRTCLDHVSFLVILPVFPELCVLHVVSNRHLGSYPNLGKRWQGRPGCVGPPGEGRLQSGNNIWT